VLIDKNADSKVLEGRDNKPGDWFRLLMFRYELLALSVWATPSDASSSGAANRLLPSGHHQEVLEFLHLAHFDNLVVRGRAAFGPLDRFSSQLRCSFRRFSKTRRGNIMFSKPR
jgi:hypothetical protein